MTEEPTPVGLPRRLWPDVREWGLPTLRMPGKMWRSDERGTITMLVPTADPKILSLDKRRLYEADVVTDWPAGWSDAALEYWTAYPNSARLQEAIMLEDHHVTFAIALERRLR